MCSDVVSYGPLDRSGRLVSLRPVDGENRRAVADVTVSDEQRRFTAASDARYVLPSAMEHVWSSLGVYADEQVVGHAMWGVDDEGVYWIGVLVDAGEQRRGVGLAAMRTLVCWLSARPACEVIRLSYDPGNVRLGPVRLAGVRGHRRYRRRRGGRRGSI